QPRVIASSWTPQPWPWRKSWTSDTCRLIRGAAVFSQGTQVAMEGLLKGRQRLAHQLGEGFLRFGAIPQCVDILVQLRRAELSLRKDEMERQCPRDQVIVVGNLLAVRVADEEPIGRSLEQVDHAHQLVSAQRFLHL